MEDSWALTVKRVLRDTYYCHLTETVLSLVRYIDHYGRTAATVVNVEQPY